MKILIIDDSLMIRNSIKRMLQKTCQESLILLDAADGKTGFDLLINEKPDIVTLDLLMPVMDGTELMQQMNELRIDCFKVVISSNFQKPVKERLYELGADLFVDKPISIEKIEMILDKYQKKCR